MEHKNIGFGVFLVCIGVLWLCISFGIIGWSIVYSFFKLWPLIFVVMGINIIFRDKAYVRAITWLLFLAVVVAYGFLGNGHFNNDFPYFDRFMGGRL